jgi:cytochrome c biogenesis protein ResB
MEVLAVIALLLILAVAVAAGTYYTQPVDDSDPFSEEYYRKDKDV